MPKHFYSFIILLQLIDILYGSFEAGSFGLSWIDSHHEIDFLFTTHFSESTNNIYSAIGFSKDTKMGEDGVVYCTLSNNGSSVIQAYNPSKVRPVLLDAKNPSIGLSNIKVKFENGKLICSFKRAKHLPGINNYFDLNNKYYILLALGKLNEEGKLMYHYTAKTNSDHLVDFQTSSLKVIAGNSKTLLIKIHACIMVISWIFLASIGIMFARYFKFIFPTAKLFNLQFWFNIHRPFMFIVSISSIIGLLAILYELKWTWIDRINLIGFIHSIFGIISITLAAIQIPVAMIRPEPTHPKRFIFNYIHRTIGLVAFVSSIGALFLGTELDKVDLGVKGWAIIACWIGWVILCFILLEVFQILSLRNGKIESIPMNGEKSPLKKNAEKNETNQKFYENLKCLFLVIHIGVAICAAAGLVYFIII